MIFIKLVCLFFFFFILLVFCLLKFSKSKINFELLDLQLNNLNFNIKFKIIIEIYLLGFVKINLAKLSENGVKILNKNISYIGIYQKIKNQKNMKFSIEFKDIINMKIDLEKFNLESNIGFENILFTVFIIPLISTIISTFIVSQKEKLKYYYNINSIFDGNNIINIKFKGIFSVKLLHILYVIKNIYSRRKNKNEQSSNRGTYANSNG